MRLLFVACLIFSLGAAPLAHAGAWLREKGTGFVSLSFGATQFSETTNALYVEYGLSDKTTIGLDVSAFTNAFNARNGIGNLFIRRRLGPADRPSRWAYEIGVGGIWGNERQLPTFKTGVSWGRGFDLDGHAGWINLDGAFIYEPLQGQHITKFDGTLGMAFNDVLTGILEVNMSYQNKDTYGAVEPSLLIRPKGSKFNFKIGTQIPCEEQEKAALKLGIWRSF